MDTVFPRVINEIYRTFHVNNIRTVLSLKVGALHTMYTVWYYNFYVTVGCMVVQIYVVPAIVLHSTSIIGEI